MAGVILLQDEEARNEPAPTTLTTSAVTGPPQQLQVSDGAGVLATLTVGAKTVTMRGASRTFTEQKRPFVDAFTRTVSNGFGLSPGGGQWLNLAGSDASFSVNGTQGLVLLDVANVGRYASINDGDIADVSVTGTFTLDKLPTGASASVALTFGYQDSSNHYRARLLFNTTGTVQAALESVSGGTTTTLGAATSVGSGFVANQLWHVRAERAGTTIRCRAWKDGTAEPGTWTFSVTDTTFPTGRVGIRSLASTGITNLPVNAVVDDFTVSSATWAHPPVVTHNTWVRTLTAPFNGTWTTALADQIRRWAIDTTPDALAYAMMFTTFAPAVTSAAFSGAQVMGQAQYGPIAADGTRIEFSDWNDYIGVAWDFPNGEHRDFPHGSITTSGGMDCSGFVRMVYGRCMGLPMVFDSNFDGINLPRRTMNMGPSGPGIIVQQGTGTAPSLAGIQVGDVVFFDADNSEPVEGQIDHCGIYLGLGSNGNYRFISSRKTVSGPTFADLGGPSILNGTGTYATRLRTIRRF
ncbi:C40 family peptidase [Streptomyces sp. NPDC058272]|uniref:C40 family peptidase n=1 Tax=Streptomyces sp. NPDC058272 TaxID=3346415 RepID=UPI0036E8324A